MATYTWIGGGNNSASNPQDWSGGVLPSAGDTLDLNGSALMNIHAGALSGDTLTLNGAGGLTPGGSFALNVTGHAHFSLADGYPVGQGDTTVDLTGADARWIGGFNLGSTGGALTVKGPGVFHNTGSTLDGRVVIDTAVRGTGSFTLGASHAGARLEFAHAVGAHQSVAINGYAQYPGAPFGAVQVDDPAQFHASVTLGFGELVLQAVKATSYSFSNDLLTLYNGAHVTDQVHLSLAAAGPLGPQNFGVTQTAAGVVIHADGADGSGHAWASGTPLGLH